MPGDKQQIFFGVGSGRCGTMLLANALNAEPGILCCHEGNIRVGEEIREQVLPHLTLQNLVAYQKPHECKALFTKARGSMADARSEGEVDPAGIVGDIAYNYAPFTRVIPSVFPDARLIYLFRDGRDFVRSVYTDESPDPTPVGWPDERTLSREERYISLGRLRPCAGDLAADEWASMTPVGKNAWLWAETNRLILDAIDGNGCGQDPVWDKRQVLRVRFEDFVHDLAGAYGGIREFLGRVGPMPERVQRVLKTPINQRVRKVLPEWNSWTGAQRKEFRRYAGPMMVRLGYGGEPV